MLCLVYLYYVCICICICIIFYKTLNSFLKIWVLLFWVTSDSQTFVSMGCELPFCDNIKSISFQKINQFANLLHFYRVYG